VSDPEEQSYYEIALTNRQVAVAFVILLACVLASFFAGVWIGRGERPRLAQHLERAAVGSEPAVPAEELEFFSDAEGAQVERRPDLQELVETPRPGTSLAEDLGLERPPAEPPPGPAREGAPPEAGPPAAGRSPAGAAPALPAEGGTSVIQVFSSRDEAQARQLMGRLQAAGLTAFLSPAEAPGGTMYRVRVGPFRERAEAERVASRVRSEFKLDTWITSP
jgi:cell division septation protein DedD